VVRWFLQIQIEVLPQLVWFVWFEFVRFHSEVLPQLDLQLVGVSFFLTQLFMDLSFLLVLSVRVLGFLLHFQSRSHQRSEVLDLTFVRVMFQAPICFLEQRTEKVFC
jgi:hypothetical protein